MLKYKFAIILMNISLMLTCSIVKDIHAKHQQTPSTIEQAKANLERLQTQLSLVEKDARGEIEKIIAEQVNNAPKGEFETTREYEARKAKANELKGQIEERINKKKEARKDELNRRINNILIMEFELPLEAKLGTYDADTQKFPLIILPVNNQESLFVPRLAARELKENFSQAEKIGIFGLQLDAHNRAIKYLLSGKIIYQGKVYQIENREMNVQRAMLMLYGNYNPTNNRAKWKSEASWWEETGSEDQSLEAIPIFSKLFRESNTNKFILVTGSVDEGQDEFGDCHACGVKIGMAVFLEKDSIWKIEVGQKDTGTRGSFGRPPEPSLVKIGMDRYAVAFSWGDMGQGIEVGGVYFVDRIDGIFKEILSIQTSEDTAGAGILSEPESNASYDSKIEYNTGSNPTYFDIKVTTRGKRGVKAGRRIVMRPFVEVKIYKFYNGEYKLYGDPKIH